MAETDPESAFSFLQTLAKDNVRDEYWSLFSTWATADPVTAAARAMSLPPGQSRENVFGEIASSWAEKDVNAALSWARNLPPGRDRTNALRSAWSRWASTNPQLAAESAAALPPGAERNRIFSTVASAWARTDPPASLAWANSLPAGKNQQDALRSITSRWAEREPQAASDYVARFRGANCKTNSRAHSVIVWPTTMLASPLLGRLKLPEGRLRDDTAFVGSSSLEPRRAARRS